MYRRLFLQSCLLRLGWLDQSGNENGKFENIPTLEALSDCVEEGDGVACGIYFSFANISDSSDDFGVRLENIYRRVHPRLKVVQVVLWAHVGTPEGPVEREAGFRRSLTGKSWFAVPFHDVDTKVSIYFSFLLPLIKWQPVCIRI